MYALTALWIQSKEYFTSLLGLSNLTELNSGLKRWSFNFFLSCSQRVFMKYRLPLREIVIDFYNELKSITSGYASFDYEDSE